MLQYWTKIALTALIVINMMSPAGQAATGYIQTMPNVTSDMLQAEYWIQKTADPNRTILDPAQIENYNRQIISAIPDVVFDLLAYPTQISKDHLGKMIDYQIPDYPCYIGGITVDEGYWQQIKTNMNLSGIQDQNPVKYGLTVNRGNLKALPTQDIIGDEPDDPAFDLFQKCFGIIWRTQAWANQTSFQTGPNRGNQ